MKALRIIFTILMSIVLTVLIFAFSLTFILKNIVQGEIVTDVLKDTIKSGYSVSEEIDEDTKAAIYKVLDDEKTNELINVIFDNYLEYKDSKNYTVSDKDLNKIKDFLKEYKNEISKITNTEITDELIEENLNKDKIDEVASNIFENVEMDTSGESILKTYKDATSSNTSLLLLGGIVLCIVLIALINWSYIKWMIPTGVCTIISGTLLTIIFIFISIAKKLIMESNNLSIPLDKLNFTKIFIFGVAEVVIGIVLIVIQNHFIKEDEINI